MINKLKSYEKVYVNLINDLTGYVRSISDALDEIGGDVHSDVWDRSCEHRDLWMCDLVNVYNYGDLYIAYFNYHDRCDNYSDSFRVIIRDWGSMNFKEIAEDIITRSAGLLASEKKFEIDSLKRRLKLLETLK